MTIAAGQTASAADILKSLNASGYLDFAAATELTIASGAVTNTQNYHLIDTQSDAASDDLDTITAAASVTDGFVLVIAPASDARTVVVKHNTGNILCPGAVDITLDDAHDYCILFYSGALTKWVAYPSGALPAFSTAGTVLRSTGSAWASSNIGVNAITVKSADEEITSNTTLQNDDHLSVSIGANETWVVEFVLHGIAENGCGAKYGVTAPASPTFQMASVFTVGTDQTLADNTTTPSTAFGGKTLTGTVDFSARLSYYIVNGSNAGTIQLQWAQNVSDSNGLTIKRGSYLRAVRLA